MMRVLLDANVIASGLLRFDVEENTTGTILRACFSGKFELVVSEPLVQEIARTLMSPYFAERISQRAFHLFREQMETQTTTIEITHLVSGVASHPEDDLVLAAAASAQVDYLVTGDKMLLQLGNFQNVPIISPKQFLMLLDVETLQDS